MHRRGYIALVGATIGGVGGCVSVDSGGSGRSTGSERPAESGVNYSEATDPWTNTAGENLDEHQRVTGRLTLPEGTYALRRFATESSATFRMRATASAPMDFLLSPKEYYRSYRDGGKWATDPGGSAFDTNRVDVTAELSAGERVVIFDNTHRIEASPDGEVEADVNLTVERLGETPRR